MVKPSYQSDRGDSNSRVFFAINLSENLKSKLEKFRRECEKELPGKSTKWVAANKLHITLKFFGEVNEVELVALKRVLSEVSKSFHFTNLELRGLGVFPNLRRPKVFWVGVHDSNMVLLEIQSRLDELTRDIGSVNESRDFKPHLTLARFRGADNRPQTLLKDVLEKGRDLIFGQLQVSSLCLIRSSLTDGGFEYEVLLDCPLTGCN